MDEATIDHLNAINRAFYAQVADDFDATRGSAWRGWERLIPYLLDVGCGNGRFGVFLKERYGEIIYHGIDSSPALLERARIALPDATLEQRDIVENPPDTGQYDLVALFGVLHHIPGADRRLALMRTLADRVAPSGLFTFTAWRFYEYPRFRKKIVDWEAGIQTEPGDYLLDWRQGERALRYCHYVDDAEHRRLVEATGLTLLTTYRDDGFTGDVNLYTLLKRERAAESEEKV
jgi:tRNA (uracil-5-)-methyltransferase TRM9